MCSLVLAQLVLVLVPLLALFLVLVGVQSYVYYGYSTQWAKLFPMAKLIEVLSNGYGVV